MATEKNRKKGKINPLTVGIAGTAAVAAGVATYALSNKNNRKKAGKMLKNIKSKGGDLTKRASKGLDTVLREQQMMREKAQILRAKAAKGISSVKNGTKKKASSKKRSTLTARKSSSKRAGASQGRTTNGMAN